MGPLRRLAFVLLALLALAFSRLLLGPRAPRAGEAAERLVIVSPHWEGIRYEFERAFQAAMAGKGRRVEMVWLNPGGTSACLRFVRSRFAEMPGGIGADLFFGGGVEPFLKLAEDRLLEPVAVSEELLALLPESVSGVPVYNARAGWYGTCLTTFGIVYNRELLRRLGLAEPSSFRDLGAAPAATWVGLADPRMSGTVHMIYELLLQGHGFDEGFRLIARMAANSRRIYHHAAEVPIEVGAGDVALGATIDSYAWAQVGELGADSIGFLAPPGESVMNPDAIAVLRGAPSPGLAREFIEFTLGEAGQALWMLPRRAPGGPERYVLGRMPVRPDVWARLRERATVTIDPFAERALIRYDPALGSARWSVVNGIVGSVLIDLHRDLRDSWREVREAGLPADAVELLTRPPVGEEEATLLAATAFTDPIERARVLNRWAREAASRYRRARVLARSAR